jgi:glyoxylase-like metal-dependent hydrolase (beta-lactamase superfamily II)
MITAEAPGIVRVPVPVPVHGVGATNCYLVRDERDGHVLIDCGAYLPDDSGHGLEALETGLAGKGVDLGDVRAVLVTHAHIDHYGMAGLLLEHTDAELWMHAAAFLDLLAFKRPDDERARLRRVLIAHGVDDEEIEAIAAVTLDEWQPFLHSIVDPTTPLWGGELLPIGGREYEVIYTPGHSHSHVCLWSGEDRILFSGDHMLPGITPPINFHHGLDDDPLGQFIDGMERIEALDPELVLPGHGKPFGEGGRRARSIVQAKHRRIEQVLDEIGTKPVTVNELTHRVYARAVRPFQIRAAMAEVLGLVAYLRKRGLVEAIRSPDGTTTFRRTGAA